jgi:hypothetical protein
MASKQLIVADWENRESIERVQLKVLEMVKFLSNMGSQRSSVVDFCVVEVAAAVVVVVVVAGVGGTLFLHMIV